MADPALTTLLTVVLLGALPTALWRVVAVGLARRCRPDGEGFRVLQAVCVALVVNLVLELAVSPAGPLGAASPELRLAALGATLAALAASRGRVLGAMLAGALALSAPLLPVFP